MLDDIVDFMEEEYNTYLYLIRINNLRPFYTLHQYWHDNTACMLVTWSIQNVKFQAPKKA